MVNVPGKRSRRPSVCRSVQVPLTLASIQNEELKEDKQKLNRLKLEAEEKAYELQQKLGEPYDSQALKRLNTEETGNKLCVKLKESMEDRQKLSELKAQAEVRCNILQQ